MESLRNAWNAADLLPVSNGESRGDEIRRRFEALGISDREWMHETGIDIKTVHRATDPEHNTRESSYLAIESALTTLEDRMAGRPTRKGELEGDADEGLVEFRLSGNFGVDVVVKGPIADREALEQSVTRLIREMRRDPNGD